MALQRFGECAVFELVGQSQPSRVAGIGVEVGQDLVHAAKLGIEHALHLRVTHPAHDALGPLGELDFEFQRRPVAGEAIGVAQAGEGLVQRVPGRPHAVQVEAAGADVTLGNSLEDDGAVGPLLVGDGAQVAVATLVLDLLEFFDQVIGALLEARVAGGGIHQAHRREVMAGDMAGELLAVDGIPATVTLGFRLQTRHAGGSRPAFGPAPGPAGTSHRGPARA